MTPFLFTPLEIQVVATPNQAGHSPRSPCMRAGAAGKHWGSGSNPAGIILISNLAAE
jgi:hypothetical protein